MTCRRPSVIAPCSIDDDAGGHPHHACHLMAPISLIERCYRLGWTDGLPVVPPTAGRVRAMIKASGRRPEEVVATIGPAHVPATVEKIAANAVMAGCLPDYFPVVLASVAAVAAPAVSGMGITIHSVTPMVIVNGPVRLKLDFNFGANALGSGNRANATVGRALHLVLRNVGGMRSGGLDAATLGHPGKYTYCFAENEEANPWDPLHVERGFARDQDAVTVYQADAPLCLAHMGNEAGEAILATLADALPLAGTYNMFFQQELFIVLSPEHASLIASDGLSKAEVRRLLFEKSARRAVDLVGKGMFGVASAEYGPDWMRDAAFDRTEKVSIVRDPSQITLVVAGRDIGGYSAVIFGSGVSVTREVDGI